MNKTILFLAFFLCLYSGADALTDYSVIIERNIFSAPVPPPPPEVRRPVEKAEPVRSLPSLESILELKGIVYLGEGNSFVVVNLRSKREEFIFREGDVIEGAELASVSEDRVVFIYDGKDVEILLEKDKDGGFVPVSESVSVKVQETLGSDVAPSAPEHRETFSPPDFMEPVTVNLQETLDGLRQDVELMRNLNVTPSVRDGRVEGFRVGNIPSGSLLYEYGIRNGDVIKSVNGVQMDSVARAYAVYNQITRDRSEIVTVEIERNNQPVVYTYRLQ